MAALFAIHTCLSLTADGTRKKASERQTKDRPIDHCVCSDAIAYHSVKHWINYNMSGASGVYLSLHYDILYTKKVARVAVNCSYTRNETYATLV
ncbi:hypothetical protein, partial [Thiolapillus sp.]|uniref:hypothetical protein n=1 Tax=Thiolapillus sp. TaxID=2017437 RepID=UPI003AF5F4DB